MSSQRRLQNRRISSGEDCLKNCKNEASDLCRLKCRFEAESNAITTLRSRGEIMDTAASGSIFQARKNNLHKSNESGEMDDIKEIINMINNKEKNMDISDSSTKFSTTGKHLNRRKYTRTSVLPTNQTKPTIFRYLNSLII